MGRSNDFKFWEPIHHHSYGDEGGIEDQPCDEIGVYSPPLWTRKPVNFRQETSSLLPINRSYSCPSPTYRLRAIMDGKRELMEMIRNIPESSHELSLKDIVEDVQENETVEKKVRHKRENRILQRNKNTKICRSQSMESEVFLLKMFLPVCLSFNKKTKARSQSRICTGQSSEGSEKPANKDWWKMTFLAIKDNQTNTSIKRSMSDVSSNQNSEKKCKSKVRRGCLF